MKILWAALALLVATNAAPLFAKGGAGEGAKKGKTSTPAADPNTAVAKAHGGKVWFLAGTPPGAEGVELSKWLSSHASVGEVSKKPNEERWPINYLAVFKKPPAKGPVTVMLVDKKEPRIIVDQFSPQTPAATLVYREGYDLEQNNGFNKGHTYIMKVGQLIKGRFVTYATGEISLK